MEIKRWHHGSTFDLEKSGLSVFVVSVISTGCNALFQLVSARFLDVLSYGELNTLLSFMIIIGITAAMVSNMAATYSARYSAQGKIWQVRKLFYFLAKICVILFFVFMVAGIAVSNWLQHIFFLSSSQIVVFTFFVTCASIFHSASNGVLQGTRLFIKASFSNLFLLATKFLCCIVLYIIGFKIYGALGAILMGTVLAFAYSMFCLHRYWKGSALEETEPLPYQSMCRFGIALYITQLWNALFTSGDVLLVKYFFSGTETGLYSSAATIGKMSTYVTGTLVFVLLPLAAAGQATNRQTKDYFVRSILYTLIISGGFAAVCRPLFQYIVLPILGNSYAYAVDYIFPVAVLMIPITLITMVIAYQTASNKLLFVDVSLGIMILGCIVVANLFHSSIQQMIYSITAVASVAAICNILKILLFRSEGDIA